MILKIYLSIALIIYLFLIYDLNKENLMGVVESVIAFASAILWLPILIFEFLKEGLNNGRNKER